MGDRTIVGEEFAGERSLFGLKGATIKDCTFLEGESPLKESADLTVIHSNFSWKYPLWYAKNVKASDCRFYNEAHAGIWYTKNSVFENCLFEEGKCFRHADNIRVMDCEFPKAQETFWWCERIVCHSSTFAGDYVFMESQDLELSDIEINGNYPFDGSKGVRLKNSVLRSKDAFWNSEDIIIEDSTIEGEYFGWNSKNVILRRCKIISHQGFCYMDNVILEDCEVYDSDLTFEYVSNAVVDVSKGSLDIKNPISGHFKAPAYRNILLDDPRVKREALQFDRKGE